MKKAISLLLVVCLLGSCLVGCSNKPDYVISETPITPIVSETPTDIPRQDVVEVVEVVDNVGFDDFESYLINYINNSNFKEENYTVSPFSLKMALALVAEGTSGESQSQILEALGVTSVEELRDLFEKLNVFSNEMSEEYEALMAMYEKYPTAFTGEPAGSILRVNNSVWKNINQPGVLLDSYKTKISNYYKGTSENIEANLMKESINTWVNDNTHGMIPEIVDDTVKDSNIVLVNTLYLKDSWSDEFLESNTIEKDFTTINGETVKKDFMCRQDDYYFYENRNSKILIIETQSDIYVAFVLGDNSDIIEKIKSVTYEDTIVELPKLEIESSFDNGFFIDYLKSMGVQNVFDYHTADFSNMVELKDGEPNVYVDDIIQKTKLVTDEDGIEGAAATSVMMMCGAAYKEPKKPKEFIANEPFSFYVFADTTDYSKDNVEIFNDIDLLFYGQNMK